MQPDDIHKLSAYVDGELEGAELDALEQALAQSGALRDELERLRAVRDWAQHFPGRTPNRDVWAAIEDGISTANVPRHVIRSRADERRRRRIERLKAFIPFYSRDTGWSHGAKRAAVIGLAGFAIAGMGRSFYQEQRANLYEEKNRVRDAQLVRAATEATWHQTAVAARGQPGRLFRIRCPQNGTPGPVWGAGVYTDDSSICTAAVHAGLIEFDRGGQVLVEIRPGQREYQGTSRNGVMSQDWGEYRGSFGFVLNDSNARAYSWLTRDGGIEVPEGHADVVEWNTDAEELRGLVGSRHLFRCRPWGETHPVWGSGPYTDDSSICTAAVHAGLITRSEGGFVELEIGGEQPRFVGSERHGIETMSFGSWEGSFTFVGEHDVPVGETTAEIIRWSTDATPMRGWEDYETTMSCPASGEPSIIWGSEPYTDDSSICTAAVHAGVISFNQGGLVTIKILPGLDEYAATRRNGIESLAYGEWYGSFRFVR